MQDSKQIISQKGAITLETAIIFPLVMAAVFLIIEAVNYGADRLLANAIMTDTTQMLVGQANHLSIVGGGTPTGVTTENELVSCVSDRVVVNEDRLTTRLSGLFQANMSQGDSIPDFTLKKVEADSAFHDSYAYLASFPYQSLLVPEWLTFELPVYAYLIVTVDAHCSLDSNP